MTSAQASLGFLASKRIACSLVRVLGSVSIGSDGIVVPLLGKNAHCSIANSMCQRKSLSCKNLCSIILQHREKYYKKRLLFCNGFFLAGFLGLGRATAFAVLSLSLNPFVVLSPALRGHPVRSSQFRLGLRSSTIYFNQAPLFPHSRPLGSLQLQQSTF